ncbi:hypothetical protein SETIT_2G379100v2 [Setaria italica]|uniref:Uncharacterized protein n=1 Tax=Setaria italica TaxID=4555 RepID=A0A368Q747_SETIT|nr:hypothetical protein SETIT_2G379100v2 [Setaria italica]
MTGRKRESAEVRKRRTLGVEDGADVGDAAEEIEVEKEAGEDEHDDGGGHHAGLIALLCLGRPIVLQASLRVVFRDASYHVWPARIYRPVCKVIVVVNRPSNGITCALADHHVRDELAVFAFILLLRLCLWYLFHFFFSFPMFAKSRTYRATNLIHIILLELCFNTMNPLKGCTN